MDWVKNHLPVHTEPIIDAVLKEMRENLGCKRIGGIGYCYGGKYVCRYLKSGKFEAGFAAHPTMMEADELRGVERPFSIAAAGMSLPTISLKLLCRIEIDALGQSVTLSSRRRSATRAKRSWTSWRSPTRSTCSRTSNTASRCGAICRSPDRNMPRSKPLPRPWPGSMNTSRSIKRDSVADNPAFWL